MVQSHRDSPLRCLFGHWAFFGIDEFVGRPVEARYITFLRDPVERVISIYFYNQRHPQTTSHREINDNNWTIEEWLEKSRNLRRFNGQVRHLLFGSVPDILTRRALLPDEVAEARRRLSLFWFVGLTESFEKDADYLYGRLGFEQRFSVAAINTGVNKTPVSDAVRAVIASHNQEDIELYEMARQWHEKFENEDAHQYDFYRQRAPQKTVGGETGQSRNNVIGRLARLVRPRR